MAKIETTVADQMMSELPGLYDHDKVIAYQNCIIDLAEHGGVNLLEMLFALRNVLLSVESRLVQKSGDLKVPNSLKRNSEDEADERQRKVIEKRDRKRRERAKAAGAHAKRRGR